MENGQQLDVSRNETLRLIPASAGQRLSNVIIDMISFNIIFFILVSVVTIFSYDFFVALENFNWLQERLFTALFVVIYYTVTETSLSGKSIGKYITKTRAVNLDGSKPDFATILGRSLSRIVPFDGFSFLGDGASGWHDKWSNTMVIDESKSDNSNE